MKTKRIPFNLEKAKAGAKLVTRGGNPARLIFDRAEGKPLVALIKNQDDESEFACMFYDDGNFDTESISGFDLFIEEEVEPMFKVGDWIVQQNVGVYKVTEVYDSWYEVIDSDESNYSISFDKEYMCHLWSIKDAKDGDVLHSTGLHNDCIFIFNGLDNWKFDADGDRAVATGYCCISIVADKMEFGIQGPDCIEVNTVKPATQKQRDLLFQKMKEAGYEWNSDTKELKKIDVDMAEKKIKTRRMTNQELSWWLRDCPDEHREYMYKSKADEPNVHIIYPYCVIEADEEVDADIYIRRNGGEWEEPLVEELESSDDEDTYQGVTIGPDTKLYTIG